MRPDAAIWRRTNAEGVERGRSITQPITPERIRSSTAPNKNADAASNEPCAHGRAPIAHDTRANRDVTTAQLAEMTLAASGSALRLVQTNELR